MVGEEQPGVPAGGSKSLPVHTVEKAAGLLEFLFAHWPEAKRTKVRTWLKFQAVLVNGRPISQFDHPLHPGDTVAIRADRKAIPRTIVGSGIKIHFEDAFLLVICKPENLLSIASEAEQEKTAYFQLNTYLRRGRGGPRERVWIVHRLDRETSGLMVFAKTPGAKAALQKNWCSAEKRYEAVVEGRLGPDQGVLESDLDESNPFRVRSAPPSPLTRHAITRYRVIKRGRGRTLLELTLETGRRHQIRVQLADVGHPIVGDEKYHAKTDPVKRLALHATALRFRHPETGKELVFNSPLPKELARLV
ncbi:MAG TPA: RluA family pseudouridine synthase [Verrucomicrobiae bacterium]|nr:RluA family pseudouridine synthase [Verrucomicrobiae bacterium]